MYLLYESGKFIRHKDVLDEVTQHNFKVITSVYGYTKFTYKGVSRELKALVAKDHFCGEVSITIYDEDCYIYKKDKIYFNISLYQIYNNKIIANPTPVKHEYTTISDFLSEWSQETKVGSPFSDSHYYKDALHYFSNSMDVESIYSSTGNILKHQDYEE